jgi:hypothetical protein
MLDSDRNRLNSKPFLKKQKQNELEQLKLEYHLNLKHQKQNKSKDLIKKLNQCIIKGIFLKTLLIEKNEILSIDLNKKFKTEQSQKKMIDLLNNRINTLLNKLNQNFKSENCNITNLNDIFNIKKTFEISKKINPLDHILF